MSNSILDFLSYLKNHHSKSNIWVKLMPIYSFCSHNHQAFALNVLCSTKSVINYDLLALFGVFFSILNNKLYSVIMIFFASRQLILSNSITVPDLYKMHQFHQLNHYDCLSMHWSIKRTELVLKLSSILPFLEFTLKYGLQLTFCLFGLNHWIRAKDYLEPGSHLLLSCYTLIRNIL